MKLTKSIIAVILGMVMAFVPLAVPVFAGGDGLTWDFYDEKTDYHFVGEAKTGKNVFSESFSAMTFTAGDAGLYLVKCNNDNIGWYGISDKYDKNIYASDIKDNTEALIKTGSGDDENYEYVGRIYRFGKGETQVLGVDDIPRRKNATIEIEYIGKVKDIKCEGDNRTYVIAQDIYSYEDDNGVNYVDYTAPFRLVTDKTDKYYTYPQITGRLYSGKCTLTAKVLGYTDTFTLKCAKVTDYIKKAEFPEGFTPVIKMYFDGSCDFEDFCPDSIVITLKNGTKKTLKHADCDDCVCADFCYKAPDGVTIYLGAYTWWNNDCDCDAYIGAGNEEWDRTPCEFTEASYLENTARLNERVITHHLDKFNWIRYDFEDAGLLYGLRYIPVRALEAHEFALDDIEYFCNYYLDRKG